ncbi:MAG: MBL fold metallo-hydrolase [Oscillospiraceae bacterium]|nr:MBL fold metallo-hydrolase [Oscillospiraceae bacterium]
MFGQPRLPRIPQDPKAKNKLIYAIVIAILVVVALISGRMKTQQEQAVPQSDADFQIHVIDVGQGDSILVLADGHAMLVDSGDADSGSTVCSYLKGLGVEKLDYAVATHLHFDHIGGFSDVLKQFPAEQIL